MIPELQRDATMAEWQALFDVAEAIYTLAPWKWLADQDLFAVRNPESGVIGYCCIMGALGEHYAVAVYDGAEGLDGYRRIAAGEYQQSPTDMLFVQRCLMASFEDRNYLEKQDLVLIRKLGRKYRGAHAWPVFRDYTPGLFPWFLNAAQVRTLTTALEQTYIVANRIMDAAVAFQPPEPGQVLLRTNASGEWEDAWHRPTLPDEPPPVTLLVDDLRLKRLQQRQLKKGGVWEADSTFTPQPIQERRDQRPFYPRMTLVVDAISGMVLAPTISESDNWQAAFVDHMLKLIEQSGQAPNQIVVRSEALRNLLAPAVEPLGVRMRVSKRLPQLDEARASFMAYIRR